MKTFSLLLLAFFLSLASAGEATESSARKVLIRGDQSFEPFEYLDNNGQPAGFNIDIARAVAEVTELEIELSLGPWDAVRRELETGQIDALVGMRYSEERDLKLDFSDPYLINSSAIFVRKGSSINEPIDLKGKKVIVQKGDIMDDQIREVAPSITIVLVDNQAEALKRLASGEHDAALCSRLRGLYLKQKLNLDNLVVVGPELAGGPYGFAVLEGNTPLLEQLNEGLRILKATGRYTEIYQHWFGLYEKTSFVSEMVEYAAWVLTPILILLALATAWSWTLKRQVAIKTRELGEQLVERQRVEEQLNAERKFRQLVEASPIPMMILSEKCILYVNRMFSTLFGYALEELPDTETWWTLACPDATRRQAILARWQALWATDARPRSVEDDPWELDLSCRDGTLRHVTCSQASIGDHHLVIFNDITIRRQAEEALTQRARIEAMISAISTRFVNLSAATLDREINRALREIGIEIGVDRCYVFEFGADHTTMSNTHEWCAEGIEPQIDRLQDLPTEHFTWFLQQLDEHGLFFCPSVADLGPQAADEKREWQLEGIQSLITVPMLREGEMVGFIGFDSVRHERHWREEIPFLLRIVGESFASALERHRFEEELRAAHQNLQDIIDFLPDATYVVDQKGKVVAWNRAVEELTGIPKDKMLDRGHHAYAEPFYGERRPTLVDLILTPETRPVLDDYVVVQQDGRSRYAEKYLPALHSGQGAYVWVKASPLYNRQGELIGAIETIRDISSHKEAQEKLEASNREMEAFVYTVSHDLRSPLTPIIGYAVYLQETYRNRLDSDALAGLADIQASGEKMLTLMEDLLDLAMVGQLEAPIQPIDPNKVLDNLLEELAPRITETGAEVIVTPLPLLRLPETLLYQLFSNLINNALLYAGKGGTPIEIGSSTSDGAIELFVRDHGPGIPAADRERIFEVFYRGARKQAASGTGIGLATVQKIAHLYNGQARVEETPGGGATLRVRLKDIAGSP